MNKTIYIYRHPGSKMEVTNQRRPGVAYHIQEVADIQAWAEIDEGEAIECRDGEGAAIMHAHLLCWHVLEGEKAIDLRPLAAAGKQLMEVMFDIVRQDECTCGECGKEPETPQTTH